MEQQRLIPDEILGELVLVAKMVMQRPMSICGGGVKLPKGVFVSIYYEYFVDSNTPCRCILGKRRIEISVSRCQELGFTVDSAILMLCWAWFETQRKETQEDGVVRNWRKALYFCTVQLGMDKNAIKEPILEMLMQAQNKLSPKLWQLTKYYCNEK